MDANRWRRVEEICDGALKLTAGDRPAYLDRACGTDIDLHREVDALLAHEATAERFLSSPAANVARDAQAPTASLIGRRFGDYEIVAKLGEGGMGEVYRARDLTLGRDVAIKILPGAFAGDRERMRRFVREARLLATVNHPFIGAIYGLIDIEGIPALVLELVDGETLSSALARRAMAVPRTLTIASQIADALDHAHRRGITHRDLKPANIMLTRDGVKLLDFGVGKWTPASSEATMTRPSTLTGEGAIVGTLHYMSPEQLEGRAADTRSDIFSFGAVLFEMLAGRKAFDGPSQASIIAAVMQAPTPKLPDVSGKVTPNLERIVAKCLEKDPEERWQSARDLAAELRWLGSEAASAPSTKSATVARPMTHRYAMIAATAALAAVALAGWAGKWRSTAPMSSGSTLRFAVQPQRVVLSDGDFDISPDGSQLVYSATTPGFSGSSLFLRRLDRFDALTLPGSLRFINPTFSPDGEWVAFHAFNVLRKIRVTGGAAPVVVAETVSGSTILAIEWPTADTILVAARDQPIRSVSANGGVPKALTTIQPETDVDHHGPELLPSGNALLFAVHGKRNHFSIAVQDLRSGIRRTLIESGFAPVYSPTGHLLFGRGSTLMAAPFDEPSLEIRGEPVTLIENVSNDARSGLMYYRLSGNGTIVYQPQRPTEGRELRWVERSGLDSPVGTPARAFESARVSPDGTHLAFDIQENDRGDVWSYELASGTLSRLTQDGDNWGPIWTREGTGILFGRETSASAQIVLNRLNGQAPEPLASSVDNQLWPTSTTSGLRDVIITVQPPTDESFLVRATRGSTQLKTILKNDGFPRGAQLSPDGRWLALNENLNNRVEIVIQSYPEPSIRRQVSVDGGRQPIWRRDGKELFFRFGNRLFAVAVDATGALKLGPPKPLFDRAFIDYDVAPDGRFLMIVPAPTEDAARQLNVVVNWRDELISRLPTRR